jgi:3-hydroxybutyryl-CoA dehydratase
MSVHFEEISEGDEYTSTPRTIEAADITKFAQLSGDFNPLHVDPDWVRANTSFDDCIAHGLLMLAITSGLPTAGLDDWLIEAYLNVERRMVNPTYPGDTVHAKSVVSSTRRSSSRPSTGIVRVDVTLHNQRGEIVQSGVDTYLVKARVSEAPADSPQSP